MLRRPQHRAEAREREAELARRDLALVEERIPDALPAVVLAQHRLAEIEDALGRETGASEERRQLLIVLRERQRGRRADHLRAVERQHEQAARALRVALQ